MVRDILDMTGKVVFVTGASSRGIGSGAARVLAEHGAKVFLTARREAGLVAQARIIEEAGGEVAFCATDVSDNESVEHAVQACVDRFGKLDCMVLAAGVSGDFVEEIDFDLDDWETVLGVNLNGIYNAMMHGYPYLKEAPGAAVAIVSSQAQLRVEGALPYTATKGAIGRMVPWWARNMGPDDIRVNAIAPGLIDTDMTNPPGWDTTEMLHKPAAEKAPLRRCASIEDCANAILFLLSDAAKCVTGNTLPVDGGEVLL